MGLARLLTITLREGRKWFSNRTLDLSQGRIYEAPIEDRMHYSVVIDLARKSKHFSSYKNDLLIFFFFTFYNEAWNLSNIFIMIFNTTSSRIKRYISQIFTVLIETYFKVEYRWSKPFYWLHFHTLYCPSFSVSVYIFADCNFISILPTNEPTLLTLHFSCQPI